MNIKKINQLSDISFIILISLITFLIWYLSLGFKIVNQPFIWDDLHLIRVFSLEEIINSWKGNWDSDGVETPSYRPIAILYYNFIGTIFKENYILLRLFVFLLMICLIIQFNWIIFKLGFERQQIVIISSLIIFTKIYTTLLSWLTLSALIFCYILALMSIILFIYWLNKKNNINLFFSILFAFCSIFTRETMYILPGILYLILIYSQKKIFKDITKNLIIVTPFIAIVIVHLFLRKLFVTEASHFELSLNSIRFGSEEISLGNFFKTLKASWLPMGVWSIKKIYIIQTITFFSWVISIIIGIFLIIKFKKISKVSFVNFFVLIFVIFLFNLPSITVARPFGIILPTLIVLTFISFMITALTKIGNLNNSRKLKLLCNFIIITIILSNLFGGYYRSNEHVKAMNIYSSRIIYFDAMSIYDPDFKHIKISKIEYDKKIKHLKSLDINDWSDIENLDKNKNTKIYISNFSPLEF